MGGFYDVLYLLVYVFMSIYAANAFAADFLNKRYVDEASGFNNDHLAKNGRIQEAVKRIDKGYKLDKD